LGESSTAFREVFRNANLRRLQLALACSVTSQWAYGVALAVYAYNEGGPAAVGLVAVIRMLPSAFAAPFTAFLADRYPRQRVLFGSAVIRGLGAAVAAVLVFADSPAPLVYALAGLIQMIATASSPARAALTPSLARSPSELTAANVVATTIESVGSFAGPAIGGVFVAVAGAEAVFAGVAVAFLVSALLIRLIRVESRPEEAGKPRPGLRQMFAGFPILAGDRDLRLLVGLYTAQTLVAGAVSVLIVVAALDLLELGESGVGWLNAAVGIGGVLGAAVVLALVGRSRLASDFGVGMLLWGAPLILIGIWPETAFAIVVLALIGVGNTIVDISGLTLLQRAVPNDVLGRVFGVLDTLTWASIALGAVLAPIAIEAFGIRGALIATGVILPALAALFWRRLGAIDRATRPAGGEIDLLRAIPIFAPLPEPALERLAASLEPVRVQAGATVFGQGDPGDRFYVVAEGDVEVSVDGRVATRLERGGSFGEIALLRDIPRTATVVARSDAQLLALERDDFIATVTGFAPSAEAADSVIAARLGSQRRSEAAV